MTQEINLFTRDGGFVATAVIPMFDPAPEIVRWGERVFVLRERQQYREAILFPVMSNQVTRISEVKP